MNSQRPHAVASRGLVFLALLALLHVQLALGASSVPPDKFKFDYGDALKKSFLFYEAERAGDHLSKYQWRVAWRKPAAMNDGKDVGVDLSGGWFDAGDHGKFGLPMAYSATMLGWSLYESKTAYDQTGQTVYAKDNLRFVLDYMLQAYREGSTLTPADDVFYYQVGDVELDHAFWGPPELMTMSRPAFSCSASSPCSEVTAGTAAALAVGSLVFADSDPAYAATLRQKAQRLYAFADAYRSSTGYKAANGYYTSYSGFWDELAWGATWLYLATGDATYLSKARSAAVNMQDALYWAHSWDNVSNGTFLLLARATGDQAYKTKIETHLQVWTNQITRSPGGLAFLNQWGSLRYASTTAFLALIYAGQIQDDVKATTYRTFALNQTNYILGDNPRKSSYVVGFGVNPPKNPHHRGAHSSFTNNINDPPQNRYELTGALVGGPASADDFDWRDDRTDYVRNEVATDYNAGYTGALAEIIELAGNGYVPPPAPPSAPPSQPPPAPAPAPSPTPTGQVSTSKTVQSDWGTGYCLDVTVTNGTAQPVDWKVTIPVEGTITQLWNAVWSVAGGQLTAQGMSWNKTVPAGGNVGFGFCASRTGGSAPAPAPTPTPTPAPAPSPSPPATVSVEVKVTADWTTGYCAEVYVRSTGGSITNWRVSFPIQGKLSQLWNAKYTVAGNTVTAENLDWNRTVRPDQPVIFGFCANR